MPSQCDGDMAAYPRSETLRRTRDERSTIDDGRRHNRLSDAVLHGIGEPLLNPQLPRFVAHLKERGAHVLFNTNAVLLDAQRGDALCEAGLDELRVSLDAVTPALYTQLRGIDKLPQILANLRAFVTRHA